MHQEHASAHTARTFWLHVGGSCSVAMHARVISRHLHHLQAVYHMRPPCQLLRHTAQWLAVSPDASSGGC
jgi:hypothetical protein